MVDSLANNMPILVLSALILDILFGDPKWLYHPVRAIGACTILLERFLRRTLSSHLRIAGVFLTIIIVVGTFAITEMLLVGFSAISPWLGTLFNIIGMYTAFALHSLSKEGWVVRSLIKRGDLGTAKERVAQLVSRDLHREGEQGIIRATLETITENITDGVVAPLLFAMIGGAPLALAYKAVNTLDSMIGYRNKTYRDFGWFAARLDDVVNFIPGRITGLVLVVSAFLLAKHPIKAIRAWVRDAQKGTSPNGGIPIATFAGALDLRLGGDCWDKEGKRIAIPYVGGERVRLVPDDILWANVFLYVSTALIMIGYFAIS